MFPKEEYIDKAAGIFYNEDTIMKRTGGYMKKICAGILAAVIILFCFTGCGKGHETDLMDLSLYFQDQGITIEYESDPWYKSFHAVDAIAFKYEGQLVRVFEFKTAEEAQNSDYKDYVDVVTVNKHFLLDSANEKIIEVFKGFDAK